MIKRKGIVILFILAITILGLVGCSTADTGTSGLDESENETITVSHPLGEVTVKKNPERIIVFDYATLDSLDEMGIEVLGLPKSNIPEYLNKFNDEKYEDVGTLFEPDFEKIYELNPDVIFISGRQLELYEELNEIAPTVFLQVDGAKYMESVTNNLKILGQLFDREEFVEEQLSGINSSINEIKEKVTEESLNALVVMANDTSISAFGKGSRFGMVHEEFGFEPADPDLEVANHGNSITFEYILEKNPDYIFIIDRSATVGGNVTAKEIFDNELIKETDAYKNGRIVYLTSQVWYVASGGLQGTNIMIEDIQQVLD
ncbi:MAG TPA: siderophore ABC transporter substrate-binding protein [Tissierellia bacterium]|nr:siderophore ABC transporter substrate-binding protein [Tissierellia bacterium]